MFIWGLNMINKTAIGFAAVLFFAGAGMDYHQQSLKKGIELGELSATGYIDTVKDRYNVARGDNPDTGGDAELAALEQAETPPVEVRRFQTGDNGIASCSNGGTGKRCVVDGE